MAATELQGRTAVVTGASSGLGVDFARELARRGCNLILVARREEQLRTVQSAIVGRYGVAVHVIPLDLAEPEAPQRLFEELVNRDTTVDVLVNNAGFGLYGPFLEVSWAHEREMLQLDIMAVAQLTKLFCKPMVERNFGFVLMVASIGAYQPSPLYASYSAAKSYVLNLGEALSYELRATRVRCTVLSPGITKTGFHRVAGQRLTPYQRLAIMPSATVARIGIENLLKGKPAVVPGYLNALTVASNRLLPRRLSAAVAEKLMR